MNPFAGLANEMMDEILSYTSLKDLHAMGLVNKSLHCRSTITLYSEVLVSQYTSNRLSFTLSCQGTRSFYLVSLVKKFTLIIDNNRDDLLVLPLIIITLECLKNLSILCLSILNESIMVLMGDIISSEHTSAALALQNPSKISGSPLHLPLLQKLVVQGPIQLIDIGQFRSVSTVLISGPLSLDQLDTVLGQLKCPNQFCCLKTVGIHLHKNLNMEDFMICMVDNLPTLFTLSINQERMNPFIRYHSPGLFLPANEVS